MTQERRQEHRAAYLAAVCTGDYSEVLQFSFSVGCIFCLGRGNPLTDWSKCCGAQQGSQGTEEQARKWGLLELNFMWPELCLWSSVCPQTALCFWKASEGLVMDYCA